MTHGYYFVSVLFFNTIVYIPEFFYFVDSWIHLDSCQDEWINVEGFVNFLKVQMKTSTKVVSPAHVPPFPIQTIDGNFPLGNFFCKYYPSKEKSMQSMYLFVFNNNIKKMVKRIWKNINIWTNLSQTRVKVISKVSLISLVSKDEMMNFSNYGLNFSWFICNYFVISLQFVGLSEF